MLVMGIKFSEWLDGELTSRSWNKAMLARRANISQSAISMVISGDRKPGIDFCEAIARALGMSVERVYRAAGILPPAPETDDIIEQILFELGGTKVETKQQALEVIRALKRTEK